MRKKVLFLWAFLCCVAAKAAIGDTFTEEYNGIVMEFRIVDNTGKNVELGSGNIGYNAFYHGSTNHTNPTGVVHIPQRVRIATNDSYLTVVGIGEGAFNGCTGVTEVVFDSYVISPISYPSKISYIKSAAFNRCTSLTTIDLSGITSIGEAAFFNCKGLTSVSFSSGSTIGKDAFSDCTNLTNISLYGVQSIGSGAFNGTGITSVYIPSTVTSIGGGAFSSGKLTSISVASGNTSFSVTNGCLISSDNCLVQATVNATSIPNTVTSIGEYAFYNNKSIASVTFPYGFVGIGNYAFYGCSNLRTVISENITPILVNNSFLNISSSATLTIPNGTTSAYTSKGWLNTQFPGGITETAAATVKADNKTITYGDALPSYTYQKTTGETIHGTPSLTCSATSSSNSGNYTISIAQGTVENHNVTFTNGTLTINKAPLTITAKNYTIIKGQTMPTFDVDYAGFVKNQTSSVLTTKPKVTCSTNDTNTPGVYTLTPSGAAATNYSMNYVNGTLTILDDVFTANTIAEGVPVEYKVLSTTTVAVGKGVSAAIPTTTEGTVTIPQTVTYNGQALTVVEISHRAFSTCNNVQSINLPNTITTIGEGAFSRCSSLTTFAFPSALTSIGMQAFWGTSLTTVTVPATVTSIGFDAFGSPTIGSLSVASGNSVYTASGNAIIEKSTNKLVQGCKNTVIPNTVKAIEDYAFVNTGIVSLTIPTSVTTFGGAHIFDSELNSLYIPHTLCSNINLLVDNSVLKPYIIPAQEYATFACAKDIDFSGTTGLTAYVASSYSNGTLTLKPVTAAKAGEGIVLKVENINTQYNLAIPGSTPDNETNLLKGVTTATTISGTDGSYTNFILTKGSDNSIGFYKTSGGTIAAGKAYLQLPTADVATARGIKMSFEDGELSGIAEVSANGAASEAIYNLNGQRITNGMRKGGLYIVNGKKVYVK